VSLPALEVKKVAMILTIHRGARQIGGSCVELTSGEYRLVLDLGLPLSNPDGSSFELDRKLSSRELVERKILPDIPGLYAHDQPGKVALFLTHVHQDHCGLAAFVHPDVPIFATRGTQALLEVSRVFLQHFPKIKKTARLEEQKHVSVGPFTVTSIPVDHSAPDAVALLVDDGKERVLYSGDLRGHGRKSYLFEKLVRNPPQKVGVLLLEGTVVGRDSTEGRTEQDVEDELVEVLRDKHNLTLMVCSSQNLDRIVSAYRAVLRTDSLLVMDLYTAYALESLGFLSPKLRGFRWDNVRVKYFKWHADSLASAGLAKFLYAVNHKKIRMDEVMRERRRILMLAKSNSHFHEITDRLPSCDGLEVIWSMWDGYWKKDTWIRPFCEQHGLKRRRIHASGHATVHDLQRLARAVNPSHLIPIHTEKPKAYHGLFDNVLDLPDGKPREF
jgi:ribonuclease J